jgi:hypothetical protein
MSTSPAKAGVHVLSRKITAVNPAKHAAKVVNENFLCLMVPSFLCDSFFTDAPETTFRKITIKLMRKASAGQTASRSPYFFSFQAFILFNSRLLFSHETAK